MLEELKKQIDLCEQNGIHIKNKLIEASSSIPWSNNEILDSLKETQDFMLVGIFRALFRLCEENSLDFNNCLQILAE